MIKATKAFLRFLGIDRAVFFSNATQATRLLTGPITMGLVLRYLTPEIQGYFYAFAGIVAMQAFLELGFSQNILQFASHEFAKLRLTSTSELEGDDEALSRMISLGRLAFRYYGIAAVIFFIFVGTGGHIFFSHSQNHGVAWQWPWWIIVFVAAISLFINPAWSLISGCNQMARIAQFRFWAGMGSFAFNALALICGFKIYVSPIVAVGTLLISLGYLYFRWLPFLRQLLQRPRHGSISWLHEIWPLQWRIAVSWLSGYFVFDIINPIAFYFCGAADAGRFGMSMQLVTTIFSFAATWINTKSPQLGMLVAARNWDHLNDLWRRSATRAFFICTMGMISFIAAIPVAEHYFPQLSRRIAPVDVTAWIAAAMAPQILIAAMAVRLRAHKREPYMWLSVWNALLSVTFILTLVQFWGIYGEAVGYSLAIWAIFIPAVMIYRAKNREYESEAAPQSLELAVSTN